MPETTFTQTQVQELLAQQMKMMESVIGKLTALNPIEQKKLDEDLKKENRRNLLAIELGKAEEARIKRLRDGCSHMRDPRTGDGVARGSMYGEWCTSGQVYQNGLAMLLCQRCAWSWIFKPAPEAYSVMLQNGLLKMPPPPDEITYCMGCLEMKPKCRCEEIRRKHNEIPTTAAA
jgi:hypothetical protein